MKSVNVVFGGNYVYESTDNSIPSSNIYKTAAPHLDASGILYVWKVSDNWDTTASPTISHYGYDSSGTSYLIASQYVSLPSIRPSSSPGVCLGKGDVNYLALGYVIAGGVGGVVLVDASFTTQVFPAATTGHSGATNALIDSGTAVNIVIPASMISTSRQQISAF
jgi:hypothetical protein